MGRRVPGTAIMGAQPRLRRHLPDGKILGGMMQTVDEQTGEILELTLDQKLDAYADAQAELKAMTDYVGRMEQDLIKAIMATGGTAAPSDKYICELKANSSFDITKWTRLKEALPKVAFEHAWVEEYTLEPKVVPAHFDTTKLKSMCRTYGFSDVFESARKDNSPTLVFKARKQAD